MFHIGANHLGNIKDTPLRVIELLKTVDYVVVEFEQQFLIDIENLQIPIPNLLVYKAEDDFHTSIIELLKDNKSILFLTQHGYPGTADPGHTLIDLVIKSNITINIIPGPSIGPAAVAISGYSSVGNIVIETFDKTSQEITKTISELSTLNYIIVILDYKESMLDIIKIAQEHLPNRTVCVCINLGWESNQRIIKDSYENVIALAESSTPTELFGPLDKCPVVSLVFGI
jgi:16S rRNA C1402 (ribose-2'-O) methylase RsmI